MNHFDANLMGLHHKVDSKVLRMPIYLKYFYEKKANVMLEILDDFFFGMGSDVPAFKVHVFAGDLEFLIGVNEY